MVQWYKYVFDKREYYLDGRTAPRTAAMDTFRCGSGGGGGGGGGGENVVRRMGTQQRDYYM